MFKAVGRTKDGRQLLVLGLSDGNCARLIANRPILFDGSVVNLPGHRYCITCVQRDGEAVIPSAEQPLVLIAIELRRLLGQAERPMLLFHGHGPIGPIAVFRAKDEQSLAVAMSPLIGPTTRTTVSGFAPGEFQPFQN